METTVVRDFKEFTLNEIDDLLSDLPSNVEDSPAYFASIDMALHDLLSKIKNESISSLYDIAVSNKFLSSYTIAFSNTDEIEKKLEDSKRFSLIKLKLGGVNDINTIKEVRKLTDLPISVDLNQAWINSDPDIIRLLESESCQYLEEPFRDNYGLKDIKTKIPVIADESFQGLSSFDTLSPFFDGINVKLMKCGGLREAFKIIVKAKNNNLKVLLGCMSGSSCAVSAMSHFSPLADWIDLDGPALISNDPFTGLTYSNGNIILNKKIGLGIDLY